MVKLANACWRAGRSSYPHALLSTWPPEDLRQAPICYTYEGKSFATGFPDPDVFEVFVKSSHIVSIGYAKSQRVLYVKFFRRGSRRCDVYRYFDVPEEVFNAFMEAESKGEYAHRAIYNRYPYERCAV